MFKKVQNRYSLIRYLPFQFKKGGLIRQFSKPCLRCNTMLHSQHMYGLIRSIDDYAALAAQATCHSCGLVFNVACIINDQKEVRQVLLPALIFRWYLQVLPYTPRMPAPSIRIHSILPLSPAPNLDPINATRPSSVQETLAPSATDFHFERSDEAVGQYKGKPIPAYIIVNNEHIPFSRIVAPTRQIHSGEYLIDKELIYSRVVHESA